MKKLDTQSPDFQAELKALLAFETAQNPEIDPKKGRLKP